MAAVPSIGRATGVELTDAADAAAHDLYVRNYSRILRFCRSRLRSREDAEDAAQTTFAYAVGALRRGVVPTLESAWLLKIARNVCLNRWAASSRRGALEVARDPQLLEELAEGHEATGGEAHALYEALQRLTEQQRRAIVLREWQGLSYAEIAEELELSQSAVETLIFRARRSLARELRSDDRLRSRSGLGSLLAGIKSLLGGGGAAVKVAAGIAVLATAGGIAAPRVEDRLQHQRATPPVPASSHTNIASSISRPPLATVAASTSVGVAPKPARQVSSPITSDAPTRAALPPSDTPTGSAPAAPGADGGASSPPAGGTPARPDEPSRPAPPPTSPPAPGATDPPVSVPTLPPPPALPAAPAVPPPPALPPAPELPATPPVPALPPTPPLPPVNPPDVPLPGGLNLP